MEKGKNTKAVSMACGIAVGAANSLFGGGGGMLAVPLLQKTGLDEKRAHATAILVILPISLLSFLVYALRGFCDFSVLIPTAIGVALGGMVGAKLLGKAPIAVVNLLFAILQLAAGIFLLFFTKG
ncbi:MAG: sulfite exporter TauE/SafE family protein [Clostridia bacterium]|nr:sulfite exporter TauE/SafE family protein [Clostridia bacterium]